MNQPNEQRAQECCGSCGFHDELTGVCFNPYSDYCSDTTADCDCCECWAQRKEQE